MEPIEITTNEHFTGNILNNEIARSSAQGEYKPYTLTTEADSEENKKVKHILLNILNNEIARSLEKGECTPYILTTIEADSEEYKIVEHFFKTQPRRYYSGFYDKYVSGTITKLERVENPYLLGHYLLKKEKLNAEEYFLFHGTKEQNIGSICQNNFDWRLSGTTEHQWGNGMLNGAGVNFSPSAHYAHFYGDVLLLARVLIGRHTRGNDSTILPPKPYDTTSDRNGNVYVKYEDDDFYPAYIVHFNCNCGRSGCKKQH